MKYPPSSLSIKSMFNNNGDNKNAAENQSFIAGKIVGKL